MNKSEMLADRIKELSDKNKRELVWQLLDDNIKDSIKTLINKLGTKFNG